MKVNSNVLVEIITIGDEILIGQIVDTNSAWMAGELNKAGFGIAQITSVHDESEHITQALEMALKRADIVLITGGIGPTNDDITKQTLCKYFNTTLIYSPEVFENIEKLLLKRQRAMNELTATQAMVPKNSTIIQNKIGTAPITWFDVDSKVVVSMPGVPYEMTHAMTTEIIPRLVSQFRTAAFVHKFVIVKGYPESALALKIATWENALPPHIKLAYLPHYGIVKLRLSGTSNDGVSLEFEINQCIQLLTPILGSDIVAYEDKPLEALLGHALKNKNLSIATAESCTGGNIARRITEIPGSSCYFKGGIVAYSNEMKINWLDVQASSLLQHGAVSAAVVEEMAANTRKKMQTNLAIATSGIAGPGGGSSEKPIGLVWIAVCSKKSTKSFQYQFSGDRKQIIDRATQMSLLLLLEIANESDLND